MRLDLGVHLDIADRFFNNKWRVSGEFVIESVYVDLGSNFSAITVSANMMTLYQVSLPISPSLRYYTSAVTATLYNGAR